MSQPQPEIPGLFHTPQSRMWGLGGMLGRLLRSNPSGDRPAVEAPPTATWQQTVARTETGPLWRSQLAEPFRLASTLLCNRLNILDIDWDSVTHLVQSGQRYKTVYRNPVRQAQKRKTGTTPRDLACNFMFGSPESKEGAMYAELTFAPQVRPTVLDLLEPRNGILSDRFKSVGDSLMRLMRPDLIGTITLAELSAEKDLNPGEYTAIFNPAVPLGQAGGDMFRSYIDAKPAVYCGFPEGLTNAGLRDQYVNATAITKYARTLPPHQPPYQSMAP